MRILFHWLISTLAIMATAYLLPGVSVNGWFAAFVVAIVLGLINAVIKPLLFVLTLPITIITLGLFTLVIDAGLVLLAARIVDGFAVAGFWWAMAFAVVLTMVGWVLHGLEAL